MIVLACETSTLLGSVAVCEDGKILSSQESMRQGSHSEALNIFIEKALQESGKKLSDIDIFATGTGPGSFTGIRICLNSVKTLAYCFNKPVVGVSSLHTLAAQATLLKNTSEFENIPIVSMINAYKNMVYVSTHRLEKTGLIQLKKPEVVRVQNLPAYIPERSLVCGDGFATYEKFLSPELRKNIIRVAALPDEPHAQTLALLAGQNTELQHPWNELLPLYLRASEAEENLRGIKYQPLF